MTSGLLVQHYITQKLECDRKDCQDAVAFNCLKKSFVVTDGATEAFGSRYWSRLLAKSWVRFLSATNTPAFMELAASLGDRAHLRWSNRVLPWYAEEKLKSGSFAAFIGLTLDFDKARASWKALSIGDCCLIQCRRGNVVTAIPLSDPAEFSYRPILLPSLKDSQAEMTCSVSVYEGTAEPGDVFLLMSDAVACWYLGAIKSGSRLAEDFDRLLSEGRTEEMDIFIDDRRASAEMKDDDVAVIYIKIDREVQ
jgi:Protein phosphatase 2C